MAYGQSSKSKNVVKVVKKGLPKKMERKAMLSTMIIRSYKGGDKLTDAMLERLSKHSKHHTISHLKQMVTQMAGGDSFDKSHKKAQKKIGK